MNAPHRPILSERDMVRRDGTVDFGVVNAIADARARQEERGYRAINVEPPSYGDLYADELNRLRALIAAILESRAASAAVALLSPRERRERQQAFIDYKRRYGMGSVS